jgi:hypothetical protein
MSIKPISKAEFIGGREVGDDIDVRLESQPALQALDHERVIVYADDARDG